MFQNCSSSFNANSGSGGSGQEGVQSLPVEQKPLAVGSTHNCYIQNSALYCWGQNNWGQLGDVTSDDQVSAVRIISAGVQSVVVGETNTCVIINNGLYCWGDSSFFPDDKVLTKEFGPSFFKIFSQGVTDVAIGRDGGCAIVYKEILCWGFADGSGSPRAIPAKIPLVNATKISGNGRVYCAIADLKLACWGTNQDSQINNSPTLNFKIPYEYFNGEEVESVSVGSGHTCAIKNQSLYCWGKNSHGQIVNNQVGGHIFPPQIVDDQAKSVSAGYNHTCASFDFGTTCWGANDMGQLGDGFQTSRIYSQGYIVFTKGVQYLSAGASRTCVKRDDQLYCFGSNLGGQLGIGIATIQKTPLVIHQSGASRIFAGKNNFCMIYCNVLRCWGDNSWKIFGNESIFGQSPPWVQSLITINPLDPLNVAIGKGSPGPLCVLFADGLKCLGSYRFGQIGNGIIDGNPTVGYYASTWTSPGVGNVEEVKIGSEHVCVRSAGAMKCWGNNSNGQLGNGLTQNTGTPVTVLTVVLQVLEPALLILVRLYPMVNLNVGGEIVFLS